MSMLKDLYDALPVEQLDSEISHLTGTETIYVLRKKRNSKTSVGRLPPEILSFIFILHAWNVYYSFGTLREILDVSHVSQEWRSTSLAWPEYWSVIPLTIPLTTRTKLRQEVVDRSRNLPLNVCITVGACNGALFVPNASISELLARARGFSIRCSTTNVKDLITASLLTRCRASKLESISIDLDFQSGSGQTRKVLPMKDGLFFPQFLPNLGPLRELHLIGFSIPNESRHLDLVVPTLTHLTLGGSLNPTESGLLGPLADLPLLEDLTLEQVIPITENEMKYPQYHVLPASPPTPTCFPRLRRLAIRAPPAVCALILSQIAFPIEKVGLEVGFHTTDVYGTGFRIPTGLLAGAIKYDIMGAGDRSIIPTEYRTLLRWINSVFTRGVYSCRFSSSDQAASMPVPPKATQCLSLGRPYKGGPREDTIMQWYHLRTWEVDLDETLLHESSGSGHFIGGRTLYSSFTKFINGNPPPDFDFSVASHKDRYAPLFLALYSVLECGGIQTLIVDDLHYFARQRVIGTRTYHSPGPKSKLVDSLFDSFDTSPLASGFEEEAKKIRPNGPAKGAKRKGKNPGTGGFNSTESSYTRNHRDQVFFPKLKTLILYNVDFTRDCASEEYRSGKECLLMSLEMRKKRGVPVEKVLIVDSIGVSDARVKELEEVGVVVLWDGIGNLEETALNDG